MIRLVVIIGCDLKRLAGIMIRGVTIQVDHDTIRITIHTHDTIHIAIRYFCGIWDKQEIQNKQRIFSYQVMYILGNLTESMAHFKGNSAGFFLLYNFLGGPPKAINEPPKVHLGQIGRPSLSPNIQLKENHDFLYQVISK